MSTFFVAVIFACIGQSCNFVYSSTLYPSQAQCLSSMRQELDAMQAIQPLINAQGACLQFKGSDA